MIIRIIKSDRKFSQPAEQIVPQFPKRILGNGNDNPRLQILGDDADGINAAHQKQRMKQRCPAALSRYQIVDDRPEQVRPGQIRHRIKHNTENENPHFPLVFSDIGQKPADRFSRILRL